MDSQDSIAVLYVDDQCRRADTVADGLEHADDALTVLTACTPVEAVEATVDADCVVTTFSVDAAPDWPPLATLANECSGGPVLVFDAEDSEQDSNAFDRLSRRIRAALGQRAAAPRDAGAVGGSDTETANGAQNRLQARYHAAFDRANDAMVVADDDGTYVDANDSAADLFGLPREDLLGRRIDEFVPADYDFDGEHLGFETNAADAETFPLVRPDDERLLVERATSPNIVPGEHLSVLREATGRSRLQETLENEREALQEMYRITADREADFSAKVQRLLMLGCDLLGVPYGFLTEIDGTTQTIVDACGDHQQLQAGETCPLSDAYCRKTITQDELVTIQNAVAEGWSDDSAYERFGLGCYAGAEIVVDGDTYGTFCFAGPDPREKPFSATERTFVELMARWTSYELEQRRATERLQTQNDRLEEFASMLSHDLRSPLNVASGFLDLARDGGDPEQFDRVEAAHDRIDRIIRDVLSLARDGQDIGTIEQVDLADTARTSWDVVATESATASLDVESDLETVHADPDRLCQLLENLFRNALEHAGNAVTVTVESTDDGFAVEDDGTGIPEAKRDAVFERGVTQNDDGTGFGLYIVEKIADAHGWTVSVGESNAGGARFEFSGVDRTGS